jgi:hypothetical protein
MHSRNPFGFIRSIIEHQKTIVKITKGEVCFDDVKKVLIAQLNQQNHSSSV